jgi:hypothetical protein
MKRKGKGIYFHTETREILTVTDGRPHPGDGWTRISGDDTLGLLAARRLVEQAKLVDDVATVDWFGMRAGAPAADEEMSALIHQFKRDSEQSRREAAGGTGLLGWLAARLKSVVGGKGHDSGHSPPAVPVRVTVRSRDAEELHRSSR